MRSQWLVSFLAVLLVIGGLAAGVYHFQQKTADRRMDRQVKLVESLEREQKYQEAVEQIDALLSRVKNPQTRMKLEQLAVRAHLRHGDMGAARQRAEKFLETYPDAPQLGTIYYCLGKIALEDGGIQKAAKYFETVVQQYPDDPFASAAGLGLASVEYQIDPIGAKKRLDALVVKNLEPTVREGVERLLGELNMRLLYSRNKMEGDKFYSVQPGDNLIGIARSHDAEVGMIMRVNSIRDPRTLQIGRRLKIPSVDFSIVVNLSDNTLTLLNHGQFFKKYKVRTGKMAGLTPTGQFVIREKIVDPEWRDPDTGHRIPSGDPKNELGSRWMGFGQSGLGIHETIHPETLGGYASRGCIGMAKEDVQELYDLVPRGTPVQIVGERKPMTYADLENTGAPESP